MLQSGETFVDTLPTMYLAHAVSWSLPRLASNSTDLTRLIKILISRCHSRTLIVTFTSSFVQGAKLLLRYCIRHSRTVTVGGMRSAKFNILKIVPGQSDCCPHRCTAHRSTLQMWIDKEANTILDFLALLLCRHQIALQLWLSQPPRHCLQYLQQIAFSGSLISSEMQPNHLSTFWVWVLRNSAICILWWLATGPGHFAGA